MDEIGVYEARTRFAELLADVERGRRVVITKHGKPIALLSPILGTDPARTQRAITRLRESRKGRRLEGHLRDLLEEGRR